MSKNSSSKVSRRIKGEGTIRKRGNGYEGRVTINVNGKVNKFLYMVKLKELL